MEDVEQDVAQDSECSLVHFCADQSSDGMTDADLYLRPHWDFRACYEIWHKVKEFSGLWKTYCTKRTCPRGMSILNDYALSRLFLLFNFSCLLLGPFVHPELQFLMSKDLLPAHKFKIHFEYCCGSCGKGSLHGRVKKFTTLWVGAADHYAKEWTLKWMKKYIKSLKKGIHCIVLFLFSYA